MNSALEEKAVPGDFANSLGRESDSDPEWNHRKSQAGTNRRQDFELDNVVRHKNMVVATAPIWFYIPTSVIALKGIL